MAESIDSGRTRLSWKPRWIVLIGVTLAVLGFIVWLAFRRTQVQVRTARAYRETITSSIATNGKIEPIDNFEAHAPMSATVKRVEILQGDWVKANQLLLQLDVADANLHMLEQKLHDRFSKPEIGHAEAQLAEARAALAAATVLVRNLNIASPHSGMAYNLPVRRDTFVAAGDLLVQVADLHRIRVRAFVDEPEIGRLQKGQPVEVGWDALPGRVWKTTVEDLPTNVVQRGTRMVGEVTCLLNNADLKLLPNTNVSVAVVLARHENALTVPREAVRQDAEGKYVFQVVNGQLKRRNVQTSVSNLTRVEITRGIPDDAVLALGAVNLQPLRDGMPVKNPI